MPKLLYISLMRLPTEKAHGLQIMENCDAFAAAGCDVTLWVARRWNTPEMRQVRDPFAYYDLPASFRIRRIPCIDIFPLFPPDSRGARLAFYVLLLSYALVCAGLLLIARPDIYYSRDELILALLTRMKAKRQIAYEAHLYARAGRGAALQRYAASRVGSVIAITGRLREDLIADRGAASKRVIVAHDGFRRERFEDLPNGAEIRRELGLPGDAFVVGYLGRLEMIGLDKGMGTVVKALAQVDGAHLLLVGGPDDMVADLRRRWLALGLPAERFIAAGQVLPRDVLPLLMTMDACVMPHPAEKQFANYTSPLKLFEYMAARRAIVASDLPAWADVLSHGETALLVPPGDHAAWANAIIRLRDDPGLRLSLGKRARERALAQYAWDARAKTILEHISSAGNDGRPI